RAIALALLTRISLDLGDLEQAVAYADAIQQLIQTTPIPLHLFPCYSILAQVCEYRNDLDEAEKLYTLAAQEIEVHRTNLHHDELRVSFFKGKQQVYEALLRLVLRHRDSDRYLIDAYNWCEHAKSRGLVDLLSQHLPVLQPH